MIKKTENRIMFKKETGYYLELLMYETMKLFRGVEIKITKYENGKNMSHLKITEVVLIHCNIVNNGYQQDLIVLYTFAPNKSFDQLADILPKTSILLYF